MSITTLAELGKCIKPSINESKIVLSNYVGTDWQKYLDLDSMYLINNNYYKKSIMKTDLFEMFLIIWKLNSESPIHDHPKDGCLLKVLDGCLVETIYQNIDGNAKYIHSNILDTNSIGFRIGNKILHKIQNYDSISVSLHIYFPPNYTYNSYNKL